MFSYSDFEASVTQMIEYASNPLDPMYVAAPAASEQEKGVVPLDTLPAQWWNWALNQFTRHINSYRSYVANLLRENTGILTLLGISADPDSSTQLQTAFKTNYPDYLISNFVDSALSETSERPVQNKVISQALIELREAAIQVVSSLPETGEAGIIYYVTNSDDTYEVYVWENSKFLLIGKSEITVVVDSELSLTSENPVQNKVVTAAIKNVSSFLPVGSVIEFAGSTAPDGYFICDGAEKSRTEYADLFSVIGVSWGIGDGVSTFNLPDLRECAVVGAGQSTRAAIGTHDVYEVGQFKDDAFKGHTHSFSWSGTTSANGGWNTYIRKFYSEGNNLTWNRNNFWENVGVGASNATIESTHISSEGSQIGSDNHTHTYSGSGTTGSSGGETTHGKQVGMNYIIRY